MESYLHTLTKLCELTGIDMLVAFKQAGIPTSTYYRTTLGNGDLRFETARKAHDAVCYLHSLQGMREYSGKLQQLGITVNPRTIRSTFKSRRIGA